MEKKFQRPSNQKSVYASFANLYEMIMNEEITAERAENAINALNGMNRTVALEINLAELKKEANIRAIEPKNFEEHPQAWK